MWVDDDTEILGVKLYNLRGLTLGSASEESGMDTRLGLWNQGLKKFTYSPIFGTGISIATNARNQMMNNKSDRAFSSPHNEYISLLIETGFIGLFLYFYFFILIFKRASKITKISKNNYELFVANASKGILISLLFINMAVGFWFNAIIPAMLMIIFGTLFHKNVKYRHGIN